MQGSEETTGQSPDELRAQQERDLAVSYALAAGDAEVAEQKSEDLLAAVQRFSRTR